MGYADAEYCIFVIEYKKMGCAQRCKQKVQNKVSI
jgi:hypothetical protein